MNATWWQQLRNNSNRRLAARILDDIIIVGEINNIITSTTFNNYRDNAKNKTYFNNLSGIINNTYSFAKSNDIKGLAVRIEELVESFQQLSDDYLEVNYDNSATIPRSEPNYFKNITI